MSPSKQYSNSRVLISKIPEGTAPNKSHFRTETITIDAPELKENELFVKSIIFSLDPWIRHEFPDGVTESPVVGYVQSKVLDSKNPKYPVGSIVFSPGEWAEYNHVVDPVHLEDSNRYDEIIESSGLPASNFNGVLGVPGLTVWHSLEKVGNLKAGETIYISSAAGTLGQIAGQLAKRRGLRVIGSAGTQEKINYLINELGFDAAFNYKSENKKEALLTAAAGGPDNNNKAGIDVYYDLVGDETVDLALEVLNDKGRIISIGALSNHDNKAPAQLRNIEHILWKQLRYEGYLVFEHYDNFPRFWEELVPLVKSGQFKFSEQVVDARTKNNDGAISHLDVGVIAESYVDLLQGKFKGKVSVRVADL
ncbi:hypothetical protein BG004_006525 [Podila humilis]|nr:hypothetical protein BG004_006525 [Podila humilis]